MEVPPDAPPGQATLINMGCGQCHGATFDGPRGNSLGAYNMDFDGFANLVYNHTTAMQQYRAPAGDRLGPAGCPIGAERLDRNA